MVIRPLLYLLMNEFHDVNWMIDEDFMETKFKLVVKESGTYTADSFTELIWIVFKHRCQHLLRGEGWRD